MLRFALGPDGVGRARYPPQAAGTGVWTRLSFETVSRAAAKQAFSRAFRAKAEAPASLAETVDALLERDALQSLSIANKAGLVVAGAFKVDSGDRGRRRRCADSGERRGGGRSGQASPGPARETRTRRRRLWRASISSRRRQLDLALGRANVIHAALKHGAASSAFLARADRLRRYRASGRSGRGDRTSAAASTAERGRDAWQAHELAEKPSG